MSELSLILFALVITGALPLVFLMLAVRFGSVNRANVHLTQAERAQLKAMAAAYAAAHPRVKSHGKPLYTKGTFGRWGLAIYPNGIYATFFLGRKGRYRFVPFTELAGLYPASVRNLLAGRLSVVAGTVGAKHLQVETLSGLTYLTTYAHRLAVIVPHLQAAMGPSWAALYHGEENLDSGMQAGQGYIHKAVRAARPPPFVAGPGLAPAAFGASPMLVPSSLPIPPPPQALWEPAAAVHAAPLGPLREKGPLLLEEPLDSVDRRATQSLKRGLACVSLGGIVIAFGTMTAGEFGNRAPLFQFLWTIAAPLVMIVGGGLLVASRGRDPARFFENGIEVHNPVTREPSFFGWGDLRFVMLRTGANGQPAYLFRAPSAIAPFSVPADIPGLPALLEAVRPRIATAAFKVALPREGAGRAGVRGAELALYALFTAAGLGIGAWVGASLGRLLPPSQGPFAPWILAGPVAGLVLLLAVARLRANRAFFRDGPHVRFPAAIVGALFVLSAMAGAAAFGAGRPDQGEEPLHIGPFPPASALPAGVYDGQSLLVNGSILVRAGESLELANATVILNPAFTPQFGVFIEAGGMLVMNNTTLRSSSATQVFAFEVLGSAQIVDSVVWGLWGNRSHPDDDGGLEIYSDDVVIRHSLIQGGATNALLVRNASPLIEGSVIVGARDDCIELHNSSARVFNNTIRDCGAAVSIRGGSPELRGNLVGYNGAGVSVRAGAPVIDGNTFTQNRNFAIFHDPVRSAPSIGANVFSSPSDEVTSDSDTIDLLPAMVLGSVLACGASAAGLAAVGLAGKRRRGEETADTASLPIELQ